MPTSSACGSSASWSRSWCRFVGPNIALFASHYISKRPYDDQAVLWHQDGSYWPLEPMDVVTLWLAVDDSVPENGCMRVIPGTQTSRLLRRDELQERTDVENVLESGMDPALVDESKAYLLPTSWFCSLTRCQVAAISCRRCQPRQRVVTPGSPSDLRPRKPPS